MDQFDEALDRRVWSLSDQRLKWDLEIALKRRGVPTEVEALMRDLISQQRQHDENLLDAKDVDMDVDEEALGGASSSSLSLSHGSMITLTVIIKANKTRPRWILSF